jgi:hypothetical protein
MNHSNHYYLNYVKVIFQKILKIRRLNGSVVPKLFLKYLIIEFIKDK